MPKTTMYMGTCTILRHVGWDNQQNKLYSVIFQRILPSISPQIQAFPLPSTTTVFPRNWTCRSTHIDFSANATSLLCKQFADCEHAQKFANLNQNNQIYNQIALKVHGIYFHKWTACHLLSNRQRKKLSVLQTNFHNPFPNQTFLVTG